MELHADERAAPRLRDDAFRPGGGARREGGVRVRKVIGVRADLRPAHARDAAVADALGAAREQAEPGDAPVLVRPVERELEAEADAEHGPARIDARPELLVVAARPQLCERGA